MYLVKNLIYLVAIWQTKCVRLYQPNKNDVQVQSDSMI